jgi:hypothetical protein
VLRYAIEVRLCLFLLRAQPADLHLGTGSVSSLSDASVVLAELRLRRTKITVPLAVHCYRM